MMAKKRNKTVKTDKDMESEKEELSPDQEELPVRRKKAKRRKTVRNPPPVDDTDSENEELSPVQEVQKTETIKNSRLRRQKIKARRCPNIHKIIMEEGIMVVRKDIPFNKKK